MAFIVLRLTNTETDYFKFEKELKEMGKISKDNIICGFSVKSNQSFMKIFLTLFIFNKLLQINLL